ncbi:hypothetical protein QA612_18620 [Evansella sp. AB-P1]|uniref:hypothetical protein n=1 Tax=Evansella sp. AB-P1 TaxID=3037653 RepID=UPI00241E040D|nr:hypothetical protein [Evansella sp. AB-P1]MDG5789476.1 hypothetical protein [Evansella sp. AB-P1]
MKPSLFPQTMEIRKCGMNEAVIFPANDGKRKCGMNEADILPANGGRSQIREENIP